MEAGTTVMAGRGGESVSENEQASHSSVMAGNIASSEPSENQQLAEAGEFEKLAERINADLTELGTQEDSVEMIGDLTKIANAGNPEWRVWACKMMNWQNQMAKFRKGFQ